MLYKVFGIINIVLIVVVTAPYWLRILNTKVLHIKKPWFQKLLKILRPLHKVLAVALLISIGIHGYLALGGELRLHTGLLAGIGFLFTVILGIMYYYLRKPVLLKAHRICVLVSIILVAIHLLFPNLLSAFS